MAAGNAAAESPGHGASRNGSPQTPALPPHHRLVYSIDQDLVAAATSFLAAGISAGAPMLAVLAAAKRDAVTTELGPEAARVQWMDPLGWYTFPAHALRRAAEFRRDASRPPVRLLGEPIWAGRSPLEVREWSRYEALLNVAFPDTPTLCAYDSRTVDPQIIADTGYTHPVLLDGRQAGVPSETFLDATAFSARCDAYALPPPTGAGPALSFGIENLGLVRRYAADLAARAGLDHERAADVVTIVNEAATNAVEHGGGRGTARIWTDESRLIIEVTSPEGPGIDPLAGHLPPDPHGRRGRGMWMIRQLADLVELRPDQPGATVRMHLWL